MMKKFLYFLLTGFVFPGVVFAGGISVTAEADKKSITIGDKINYSVSANYPENYSVNFSTNTIDWEEWLLLDQKEFSGRKNKQNQKKIVFTLTTFTTGQIFLPAVTLSYTSPTEEPGQITTSSVSVVVVSLLEKYGDAGDIRDIKKPLAVGLTSIYILLFLILLIVGVLAIYTQRRKKQKEVFWEDASDTTVKISPREEAIQELEKLLSSDLLSSGRIKEFYIILSNIVRKFLGRVYEVDMLEKTSFEICQYLRPKIGGKKEFYLLREFFANCDLVKFARYLPQEKECQNDVEKAKTIVNYFSNATG